MRTLSFPYSPLLLAALITVAFFKPLLAEEISVVDPTTGETVSLSSIDVSSLSDDDRHDIGDQLADMGIEGGPHGPSDAVEASDSVDAGSDQGDTVGGADGGEGPGGPGGARE